MKVKDERRTTKVGVNTIAVGEGFEYDSALYLKIADKSNNILHVDLANGRAFFNISNFTKVIPVDIECIVRSWKG